MKPIQTIYKGYKFRSRLEAKWAVFLDALGMTWSYEDEGFDLGDGLWYLPDFFVEEWDCWIEIKGKKPIEEEIVKCARLAEGSNKLVLLVAGSPAVNEYNITVFNSDDPTLDPDGSSRWEFGEGRYCGSEIWLVSDEIGASVLNNIPQERDDKPPLAGTAAHNIVSALNSARQARFEHGESP